MEEKTKELKGRLREETGMHRRILQAFVAAALLAVTARAYAGPKVEHICLKPTEGIVITLKPNTIFKVTMESVDGTKHQFTVKEDWDRKLKVEGKKPKTFRSWVQEDRSLTIGREVFPRDYIDRKMKELVPKLKDAVKNEDRPVVNSCVEELEKLLGAGEDIFNETAKEKDSLVRQELFRALLEHVARITDLLLKTLKDRTGADARTREDCARLLKRAYPYNDDRSVVGLLEALKSDPVGKVRDAAAGSLAKLIKWSPKRISGALFAAYRKEKDEETRTSLLSWIMNTREKHHEAQAWKETLKALKNDPSPRVRSRAAWYMLYGPRKLVVKPLLKALDDEDEWVRSSAAYSLKNSRPRDSFKPLMKLFKADKSERVLGAAGNTLLELDAEKAFPDVIEVVKYKRSSTYKDLLKRAIREACGREAVRVLLELISDKKLDPEARYEALNSLERQRKSADNIDTYAKLLKEEKDPLVLEKAVEGMKACGKKGRPYLKEFTLDREKDSKVRARALGYLEDTKENFDCFAELIKERDADLRLLAARKLAGLKDERAVPLLEEALKVEKTEKGKKTLEDLLRKAKSSRR